MKTLDELGLLHGTDKASSFHGYLNTYDRYFHMMRMNRINLLEIGIAGGASLRMWRDYFPNAMLYGLDHNPESVKHEMRAELILGDVADFKTWNNFQTCGIQFDVVIDDGGHFSHQIMDAFSGAWPLLKPGGIYAIEDLHAPYAHENGGQATIWDWILLSMHELNEWGEGQCGKPTKSDIAFIHLYKSLVIIGKR